MAFVDPSEQTRMQDQATSEGRAVQGLRHCRRVSCHNFFRWTAHYANQIYCSPACAVRGSQPPAAEREDALIAELRRRAQRLSGVRALRSQAMLDLMLKRKAENSQ